MGLTPDTYDFRFLEKKKKVLGFLVGHTKILLKMPGKNSVKFFFGNLIFSKSKQRWHAEGPLCLDLKFLKIFQKKIGPKNFSGQFKKNFFWA